MAAPIVFAITGGKGGVGKSVFAANFAITLGIETRQPVLLMDLDAKSCGDQNLITGLKPVKTIAELISYTGAINAQTVGSLCARHQSGMHFIAAVRGPDEILSGDADSIARLVDNFGRVFPVMVLDIGSDLGAVQLSVLNQTTMVIVLTVPEILAVNQTYRMINDLTRASLPQEAIQVVVNKVNSAGIPAQNIAQSLRRQVLGVIPQDDVTTTTSLQRGAPFVLGQNRTPLLTSYFDLARTIVTSGILQKLQAANRPQPGAVKMPTATTTAPGSGQPIADPRAPKVLDARTILRMRIHQELIKAMDLKKGVTDTHGDPAKERQLRDKTHQLISQIVDREAPNLTRAERVQLVKEVLEEALGLGPLEDLLADESVTEVMVNGRDNIFVEKSGRLTKLDMTFTSNQQLRNIIERIVTPLGRRIDEKTPYVDARLRDGSRVHAIIEPLAIDGPALTIRKFSKKAITFKNYIEWGSMTESMVDFFRICVENGLNIVISGGTGSGKTTLLNVLSSFIPATERIVTVEDAAELQLKQVHVVRLETRPANMEGTGEVTIRHLVKNTLRMRPDRIVVGECRGGEALDMLAAMSTGHDGSMTTVHSNSPKEAINRIVTLCSQADNAPPQQSIKEQIASAVDLIIQISRLADGSRKVISVSEVVGMQGEIVTQQEIFRFKEEGFDKNRKIMGQFQAMGLIPSFVEEFERKGTKIPRSIFTNSGGAVKKASGT